MAVSESTLFFPGGRREVKKKGGQGKKVEGRLQGKLDRRRSSLTFTRLLSGSVGVALAMTEAKHSSLFVKGSGSLKSEHIGPERASYAGPRTVHRRSIHRPCSLGRSVRALYSTFRLEQASRGVGSYVLLKDSFNDALCIWRVAPVRLLFDPLGRLGGEDTGRVCVCVWICCWRRGEESPSLITAELAASLRPGLQAVRVGLRERLAPLRRSLGLWRVRSTTSSL